MYQTLFTIPKQIAGIDVFGFGWLLGIWAIAAPLASRAVLRQGGRAGAGQQHDAQCSHLDLHVRSPHRPPQRPQNVPTDGENVLPRLNRA